MTSRSPSRRIAWGRSGSAISRAPLNETSAPNVIVEERPRLRLVRPTWVAIMAGPGVSPTPTTSQGGGKMSRMLNLAEALLGMGRTRQQLGRVQDAFAILSRLSHFRDLPKDIAEETQARLG